MKSKITIDIDWDNQPIIKIEYADSEDVRDKMVKRFMRTFEGKSCWANFSYQHDSSSDMVNGNNSTAILRPLKPTELHEHTWLFNKTAEEEHVTKNNETD